MFCFLLIFFVILIIALYFILFHACFCTQQIELFIFLQSHTDKLNTQVALHQLYQYASKYYDGVGVVAHQSMCWTTVISMVHLFF